MKDDQLLYTLAITLIDEVGTITAKRLISYCGGAEAVFQESKRALATIPGIRTSVIRDIKSKKVLQRAGEEIDFIEKNHVVPLFYTDPGYPKRLAHCDDAPVLLFTRGIADFNCRKVLAVVGTREPSDFGREFTKNLIAELPDKNILVASGLAYGIDITAHRACIKHDLKTVAVLGNGLDKIYPAVHSNTAHEIELYGGALMTECLSKSKPDRENFPKRNRIVAGMSDAVLVIESANKGGSLITADIANSYNRDVFAVPGRPGDKMAEGCNWLIKTSRAALISSCSDLIQAMSWDIEEKKRPVQQEMFSELSAEERKVAEVLKSGEPIAIDDISLRTQLPVSSTAVTLLNLEFKGIIRSLPGKVYCLN